MQKNKDGYHRWIEAIVVVEFDLDEGQKVILSLPEVLPPNRQKQISMLAFPDSNCCSENQTLYKYIFKTSDQQLCFVSFKQKKDPTNKRGYSQKSFVVITRLPFLMFFEKLSEFLVFKLYGLSNSELAKELSVVLKQSEQWPDPEPLSKLKLPVLDYHISSNIPNYLFNSGTGFVKAQNFPNSARKQPPVTIEEGVTQEVLLQLGRFQEVRLTQIFLNCEEQLWSLWESAMLNKALLIMAETPYLASQAVLAAASLTNPIEYAGDIHPYVTVYDSHLSELQLAEENVVLGGTNPLFSKLFAKTKVEIMYVGGGKAAKHLKPIRELFIVSGHQHHRLVNESALRKYFYKINCGIISVLQEYLDNQTNDLKFFKEKEFLRFVKKRNGQDPLDQILEGSKASMTFWEEFVESRNFLLMLRARHVVRNRN